MGCYGIGVTRILGAAIEQNHDERGIIWPRRDRAVHASSSARSATTASTAVRSAADDRCTSSCVAAGIDVMLDDRGERPGAMFADWELIGVPHRVVLSDRGLKEGKVEYQGRRDASAASDVAATPKCRPS